MLPMDWKELIQKLIDRGMTQQQIAARCDVSQSAISELATGKATRPRFQTGMALIGLLNDSAPSKEAA